MISIGTSYNVTQPESSETSPKIIPLRPVPAPQPSAPDPGSDSEPTWPIKYTKGGAVVRVFRSVAKTGYTFFTVAYYQHGARRRENLADESEARARARDVLASLVDGEVDAASMRLQDVRAYQSANALLTGTGVSLETACREYAQAFALLRSLPRTVPVTQAVAEYVERHAQLIEGRTIAEACHELLETKRAGRATSAGAKAKKVSAKYIQQLRICLDKLQTQIAGPITDLTGKRVNEFLLALKTPSGEAVSGRTRNNYAEAIRQLLRFAKKQKYIPHDSAAADELEKCAEDDFAIEIFTPEELKKLLSKAATDLAPVIAIGAFAGLRYFELTRLDWSEVNLKAGHIEVKARKAKTRSRRLVPLCKALAAWLRNYRKPEGPVWPLAATYLSQRLLECAAAAGVTWKHNALRHSFISYRVAEVKNVDHVALEAGNSPDMIFQHYRELVTENAAKVWFGLTPAKAKA